MKIPQALSVGEEEFAMHCQCYKLTPVRELQFHPTRQWRFDFAWPTKMVAAEIEGGTRKGGRHNKHAGLTEDAFKYNSATLLGWRVFRFTTEMVHSGCAIDTICEALRKEPDETTKEDTVR